MCWLYCDMDTVKGFWPNVYTLFYPSVQGPKSQISTASRKLSDQFSDLLPSSAHTCGYWLSIALM